MAGDARSSFAEASSAVTVREETVVLPTCVPPLPEASPIFSDRRVNQGTSGRVFPTAFTDRLSTEKVDKPRKALYLENEHLRLMILPEIGGRIHEALDKSTGYHFVYRQHVIKPALIGLFGPWISGGVEFDWPQHHRPTTFMPVDHVIDRHEDGSATLWLGEHEPVDRTRGTVGIRLRPGKAFFETVARLHNRTPFVQTFLWWVNVGVHVTGRPSSAFARRKTSPGRRSPSKRGATP